MLRQALAEPARQIALNSGIDAGVAIEKILKSAWPVRAKAMAATFVAGGAAFRSAPPGDVAPSNSTASAIWALNSCANVARPADARTYARARWYNRYHDRSRR